MRWQLNRLTGPVQHYYKKNLWYGKIKGPNWKQQALCEPTARKMLSLGHAVSLLVTTEDLWEPTTKGLHVSLHARANTDAVNSWFPGTCLCFLLCRHIIEAKTGMHPLSLKLQQKRHSCFHILDILYIFVAFVCQKPSILRGVTSSLAQGRLIVLWASAYSRGSFLELTSITEMKQI